MFLFSCSRILATNDFEHPEILASLQGLTKSEIPEVGYHMLFMFFNGFSMKQQEVLEMRNQNATKISYEVHLFEG